MAEARRSYLLVPTAGAGEGIGHLVRCVRLAAHLGSRATILTSRLDSASKATLATMQPRPATIAKPASGARWDLIVVDARRASRAELLPLMAHGRVVCLDEGGEAREYASFTIDAIPGLPGARAANLSSPSFLDLPPKRRASRRRMARVLVSFGGEDRSDLSGKLLSLLLGSGAFSASQVHVVEGPLFSARRWPEGVSVVRGAADLTQLLPDFDLVFTHYGMTAFESLATGVPAILLNPSAYHHALATASGFPTIGIGAPRPDALARILRDPKRLRSTVDAFNGLIGGDRRERLARLLADLVLEGDADCPVCGRAANRVIARFAERTYRRCSRCAIVHMERITPVGKRYGARYFSSEYRAQYGRTYLEDFNAIKAACRPRVRILRALAPRDSDGAVVDVGCAYGPFLDALKEEGIPGFGIDVAPAAVSFVRRRLGVPAVRAEFERVGRSSLPSRIIAVTLWYVIEHFSDTDLTLRKAAALLPPGGVLAFSTPNGRGISARKSLHVFLRQSPADHFTVMSPRGLKRLLAGYELGLRRVRVTGHHPERFPGIIGKAARRWRSVYAAVDAASRLLGLGDTFEAYAVKGAQ
jgi:2-polyprenyl-3-methyl-5-hydroxy-6-metoxy-1,4-benzoquinol methylase